LKHGDDNKPTKQRQTNDFCWLDRTFNYVQLLTSGPIVVIVRQWIERLSFEYSVQKTCDWQTINGLL